MYILSRLEEGAVEWNVLDFIRLHASDLGKVYIWLDGSNPGDLVEKARSLSVEVHHNPRSVKGLRQFSKFIRGNKIDVVHANTGFPSGMYLRIAKRADVPVRIGHWYYTLWADSPAFKQRIILRLQGVMSKVCTNNWAVSKTVKESIQNAKLRLKTQILYNGYNFSKGEDKAPKELSIVHVGRFNRVKNHALIWKILDEIETPFTFTDFGLQEDSELRPSNERLQDWKAANKKVNLLGKSGNVTEVLNEHRVFLFPSLSDGLSGSLVQAASQGLHCVVSDIPAHREVADFFDTVKLVELQAPAHEWAEVIEGMPSEKDLESAYSNFKDSPFRHEVAYATWLQAYGIEK
ncbi:MAG: glycosyltransferase [Flavobacteriia bacterium]|nr:glycosyltransferase [Flavobacteriia bacterium]